jgi:L-cysteine desulfidase
MNTYFNRVLKDQVKPATGCTEPVAIALACAKAASLIEGEIEALNIVASKGLYKNASAVGIPGTNEKGIAMAAFMGVVVKKPELGMRILEVASEEDKKKAKGYMEKNMLQLGYTESDYDVYVKATVKTSEGEATAIIGGSHDRFIHVSVNGMTILEDGVKQGIAEDPLLSMRKATVAEIVEFATQIPLEDIAWLEEAVELNRKISLLGQKEAYGLGIGRGLRQLVDQGLLPDDLLSEIRIQVSAAADARMGGAKLPVMTSCGSGNQGILIALPLKAYCEHYEKSREELVRALAIANLTNALAKAYLGKLSPLCGCSVSAGLGAAAGLTWLAGGTLLQIEGAIKGMIANLTGTLCDGAKATCALKLETAAVEAYTYAMLSLNDVYLNDIQGIVEKSTEDSIANLEAIGKRGMQQMDQTVLDMLDERMNR